MVANWTLTMLCDDETQIRWTSSSEEESESVCVCESVRRLRERERENVCELVRVCKRVSAGACVCVWVCVSV